MIHNHHISKREQRFNGKWKKSKLALNQIVYHIFTICPDFVLV